MKKDSQATNGLGEFTQLSEFTQLAEFAQLSEFAQLDRHRKERIGIAEAVYAPGKTPQQCAEIVSTLVTDGSPGPVLLSRPDEFQTAAALEACPGGEVRERLIFWNPLPALSDVPVSEQIVLQNIDATTAGTTTSSGQNSQPENPSHAQKIIIATAGTGDLPPARECQAVLEAYGIGADIICDIGVAGIHRTLGVADKFYNASAVVVVAGMEGALASVIGGLTPAPVIAVPSSVGYGSSLEGVTALLAMLSSCAPGIVVVGIDNGFGAACAVLRLIQTKLSPANSPPADSPPRSNSMRPPSLSISAT